MSAKTPSVVVQKLSAALNQALKASELITALKAQGAEPGAMDVSQFTTYVKSELDKWGGVVKAGDIKAD